MQTANDRLTVVKQSGALDVLASSSSAVASRRPSLAYRRRGGSLSVEAVRCPRSSSAAVLQVLPLFLERTIASLLASDVPWSFALDCDGCFDPAAKSEAVV